MSARSRLLLWHLRRKPGMTTGELARVAGATPAAARDTRRRLRRSGRVVGDTAPTRDGHATVWRVSSSLPPSR